MKLLLLITSTLLILLIVGLWVGSGSYPERWKIQERSRTQELENAQRKEEIKKMQTELDDASSGVAAIEERARSELGMTRKGETFYEVILQDKPKQKSIEIKSKSQDTENAKNDKHIEKNKIDSAEN